MSFSSHAMVKMFFPGSARADPSHSHTEEKGGFTNFFIPCHFKVVNSKSEIPFFAESFFMS